MDQLEKIITTFRDEIQNDLPHEGHFERFEMKLNTAPKRRTKYWIGYVVSIAAVVVFAILLFTPGKQTPGKLTLSDLSPQYADVEYYYTSTIEN